jgi:hypothetical protein
MPFTMLLLNIKGSLDDFSMILKSLHDSLMIIREFLDDLKVQFLLNSPELVKCGIYVHYWIEAFVKVCAKSI